MKDKYYIPTIEEFHVGFQFIKEYKSITEAAKITNSLSSKISLVCQGKRKKHNNYKWKYKYD